MENKSIIGQCPGVTGNQAGNIDTINPTNPTSSPTLEVTGTLVRQNNGGGVGNFIFCKNMGGNTPFHPVQKCKDTKNVPPCLKSLTGAGQGSISFDLLVKATPDRENRDGWTFDPKMGGGGAGSTAQAGAPERRARPAERRRRAVPGWRPALASSSAASPPARRRGAGR